MIQLLILIPFINRVHVNITRKIYNDASLTGTRSISVHNSLRHIHQLIQLKIFVLLIHLHFTLNTKKNLINIHSSSLSRSYPR